MIYLRCSNGQAFMFIEQGNIERMKTGKPMSTPDGQYMVCFTPDMQWTQEQVEAMVAISGNVLDADMLDFIHKEGLKRELITR